MFFIWEVSVCIKYMEDYEKMICGKGWTDDSLCFEFIH